MNRLSFKAVGWIITAALILGLCATIPAQSDTTCTATPDGQTCLIRNGDNYYLSVSVSDGEGNELHQTFRIEKEVYVAGLKKPNRS